MKAWSNRLAVVLSLAVLSPLAVVTVQGTAEQEGNRDAPRTEQAQAGIVVVFKDGRELRAVSAILVGDKYKVEMKHGIKGTFPAADIREVRPLTDAEERDEQEKAEGRGLGEKRSKDRWTAEQYEYFKHKIAKVDGTYYSAVPGRFAEYRAQATGHAGVGFNVAVWPAGADEPRVEAVKGERLQKGACGMLAAAEVLQVLGSDTLLVRWEWYRGFGSIDLGTGRSRTRQIERDLIVYHVSGFPTESLVNGQDFARTCMVVTGTFTYQTAAGATNTVLSLKPVGTLSKEEFAECLKQGLALERWDCQPVRCPKCGGRGRVQIDVIGTGRRPLYNPCERCGGSGIAMRCRRRVVHWSFAEPRKSEEAEHAQGNKSSMTSPKAGDAEPVPAAAAAP